MIDDPVTAYCHDVLEGRIVAGELVHAACQRHLTDIETGHERGLFWRPDEALKIINAYPANFQITDGPWPVSRSCCCRG